MQQDKKPLGRILLEQRAVSPDALDRVLSDKGASGRLASRLTDQGVISEVEALKGLSEQHGIPGIDLGQVCLRLEDLDLLPREIAEKHLILPVLVRDDRLFVATANPRETKVIEELEFVTGKHVYPYVALEAILKRVIQAAYTRKARGDTFYIGERCPQEVLDRLRINPDGSRKAVDTDAVTTTDDTGVEPPTAPTGKITAPVMRDGAESMEPVPRATSALVVDDATSRSFDEEVRDEDFCELSRELSVVTEQPIGGAPEAAAEGVRTVLVVDDEADIRRMVVRLLQAHGLRVLEADRGMTALRLVKDQCPDLIVLDAMLPEVHGFEIARRIKGSERYGAIPIIMVSAVYRGWRFAEDLKDSYGVDHFLEKPFRIEELLRVVDLCLSGSEAAHAANDRDTVGSQAEQALNAGVAAYRAGRIDDAISELKRGVSIDPLAYRLHFHLGLLFGKQGKVFDAISELERAIELNSKHFAAAKNLAILYQKAGFRNRAAEMWERALRLAPDEQTRLTVREHLLNLL